MKYRSAIGWIGCFLLMSFLSIIAETSESSWPPAPGLSRQSLTLPDGTTLRYTLSIPPKYSVLREIPLVIALHYGGTVTPWYSYDFTAILIEPALRGLKAVIASPDCPGKGWDNPDSASAVMGLMDFLKQKFPVDPNRILLTGFSMGGIGTWYLVSRHPDAFTAAIPISGMTTPEVIAGLRDTPLYVIHSNRDQIFPIQPVKEIAEQMKQKGIPVRLAELDGISHYDTPRFVEPLRDSIPWLKKIWNKKR